MENSVIGAVQSEGGGLDAPCRNKNTRRTGSSMQKQKYTQDRKLHLRLLNPSDVHQGDFFAEKGSERFQIFPGVAGKTAGL